MIRGYFFDSEGNQITQEFSNERQAEKFAEVYGLELWHTKDIPTINYDKLFQQG